MIHPYRESVLSQLYPGFQHSSNCLIPAVSTFETVLELPEQFRHKCIWRLDQGFGGDSNINWLLDRQYQLIAKGCSNRRVAKLAQEVQRWRSIRDDKLVGQAPTPEKFVRPVDTFVIRYQTRKGWKHSYLLSTLNLSGVATAHFYDQRGGSETEFRTDKSGGAHLDKRRKHKRDAQEAWVLLTDMNHNFMSWFSRRILANSPFASYGFLRISRDLFRIPGLLKMENGRLLSVKLLRSSPYAVDLIDCLQRFWD